VISKSGNCGIIFKFLILSIRFLVACLIALGCSPSNLALVAMISIAVCVYLCLEILTTNIHRSIDFSSYSQIQITTNCSNTVINKILVIVYFGLAEHIRKVIMTYETIGFVHVNPFRIPIITCVLWFLFIYSYQLQCMRNQIRILLFNDWC